MAKLAIISDDLTGGNAVGAEFSRLALPVVVTGKLASVPHLAAGCDVLVYNTETRNKDPREAAGICLKAATAIADIGAEYVVKKIDSLLRGNIAEEIDAIAMASGFDRCLLIPAAPAVGRTTVHGVQHVDGIKLEAVLQEADPSATPEGSDVVSYLKARTSQQLHRIDIDDIEAGTTSLSAKMSEIGSGIVVCDAIDERHVHQLVEAALSSGYRFFAGTYGIGAPLARCLSGDISCAPILIISGSLSRRSREQVDVLSETEGCAQTNIDIRYGMSDLEMAEAATRSRHSVQQAADAGLDVIISTASDGSAAAKLLRGQGRTAVAAMESHLASAILMTAAPMIERCKGIIVSGGSTANALLEIIGADGLAIHEREVLPGMPLCTISGGKFDGLFFLTKPGSFGSEQSLAEARSILKRIVTEEGSQTAEPTSLQRRKP